MINFKYFICGTGRCGTVYFSRLLTSLGEPCSHEGIFTPAGAEEAKKRIINPKLIVNSQCSRAGNWLKTKQVVAEASYMAAPFLSSDLFEKTKILHVVRDPIKVISSFVEDLRYFFKNSVHNPPNPYMKFIYKWAPELVEPDLDAYTRGALYYVRWNQMIEMNCFGKVDNYQLHRLEDPIDSALKYLCLQPTDKMYNSRTANSRRKGIAPKFSIKMVRDDIRKELTDMMERYGYKTQSKSKIFFV